MNFKQNPRLWTAAVICQLKVMLSVYVYWGYSSDGLQCGFRNKADLPRHCVDPTQDFPPALFTAPVWRKAPHSTQWTMVKISRVYLMFMISSSSSAVFLANWVPEFLKGSILDIITSLWGAHRMSSIINAQGKVLGTAGAFLWVGEIYSVKGNGKLNTLFWCWGTWSIFILFCLHFKCPFLIFRHICTFSFSLLWARLLWA